MRSAASSGTSSVSSTGYRDGLGHRTLEFDRTSGDILERLVLRPELWAFEPPIRDALMTVSSLEDERFSRLRDVQHDEDGRLTVASDYVAGRRISEALDLAAEFGIVGGLDAALGLLLEIVPALARLHEAGRTHGLLGPGYVTVTSDLQLVILDSLYAQALEHLHFSPDRLWSELRVARAVDEPSFDIAGDLSQAAMLALSVMVGRPLRVDEFPSGLSTLRQEVLDVASIRGSSTFARALETFLDRILPVEGRRSYRSADEAAIDARKLVRREMGIESCRAALTDFFQQIDNADAERGDRDVVSTRDTDPQAADRVETERIVREKAEAQRRAREKADAEEREHQRVEAQRLAHEQAEAERAAREQAEAAERERQRAETERLAREKAEAERIARETAEAQARERARLEAEQHAREKAESERVAHEKAETEARERKRQEADRIAREKAEAEERERKRLEAERVAHEKAEAERIAREKAEAKRIAKEKADAEERERKRLEAERVAREKAEAEARERKRLEAERIAREKAEAERVAREKAEAERVAREKAEAEERQRKRREAERLAKEKAEAEERERKRVEAERLAKEKAEAERVAREKAEAEERERTRREAERLAKEKAEAEERERKRIEAERLAREKAEAERVAREKAEAEERERKRREAERVAKEKAEAEERERKRREAERAREKAEAEARERKRVEAERVAREKAEAEERERKRREAERAAREKAEAEARERKRVEAERLAREKAEAEERERITREKEDAERRERELATQSSSSWLVPPEQASKFEVPADRATPVPNRNYPIYVPPPEQPRWSGAPVDVSSVGGHYDPPAPTPLPNLAPQTSVYGAPTPIRLKGDSGVSPRPPAPERPLEREDQPGKYEHRIPSFEPQEPERRISWKLVAAAGIVLAAGLAAFYLYSPISSPLLAKPVETKSAIDKPTGSVTGGHVDITTDPAGAKILIDGKDAGQSPLALDGVSAGRHVVTMMGDGGAVRRTIRVETGKSVTLNVAIYSGFAAVSAPFIVTVSEGGRTIGTSENPLMLAPGRHALKFSNTDLSYSAAQSVEIQPGESTRVDLDPKGTANINAEPWAEVYIDGVKVGDTPLANLPISLGAREIVFKNPQLGERKVVATITAGSPAIISVDFNK